MHPFARLAAAALLGGAVAAAIILFPSPRIGRERLAAPATLSPIARALLDRRMDRHANQLGELDQAVLLLDFDKAVSLADRIASEPTWARPTTDDATLLNAQLPPAFFTLQSELAAAAAEVSAAARAKDIGALSLGQAKMTKTCVACHSAYLSPHR